MKSQNIKAIVGLIVALVVVAAVIFLSAWTLHYWQAWVFLAVFFVTLLAMNIYLMRNDPKMLEKRSKVVPRIRMEQAKGSSMS
jgi:formate hydrogenlyase subunit 3/multisubunit Na+/H+ antiporter MnhD subunit